MKIIAYTAFLSTITSTATAAFTATTTSRTHKATTTQLQYGLSRRETLAAFAATAALSLPIGAANALNDGVEDSIRVTKKLASPAALRAVKSANRKLIKAEGFVLDSNYEELKAALRVPPFTEVRKNANIIIGSVAENEQEPLRASYAEFIRGVEALDSQASLGMRGSKNVDEKLTAGYNEAVAGLKKFVVEAEKVADVPLEYASDSAGSSE